MSALVKEQLEGITPLAISLIHPDNFKVSLPSSGDPRRDFCTVK
jgi:hypothetical protein